MAHDHAELRREGDTSRAESLTTEQPGLRLRRGRKKTALSLRLGAGRAEGSPRWGGAGLTCVLDSHVGEQEVLPEGAVGAKAALEWLVTDMGQLVVQ